MSRRYLGWIDRGLCSLIMLLLGGCTSVPIGAVRLDQEAKRHVQPSEVAGLYVFRSKDIIAYAVLFSIQLDDQYAGSIAPGTYLHGYLQPGVHTLTATGGLPPKTASLTLIAERGRSHFFKVGPGWHGLKVEPLTEAEGRRQVDQLQLSGENLLKLGVRVPGATSSMSFSVERAGSSRPDGRKIHP